MKKIFMWLIVLVISISMVAAFPLYGCKAEEEVAEEVAPVEEAAEEAETTEGVTLIIASVNNPDMLVMEELGTKFTDETGIKLNFVILPENELRQKVTEDVGLGAGKFDIVTIGTYDTPFWAANNWIVSLEPYFKGMSDEELAAYDRSDFIAPIISALSLNGEQYAIPFYGESSMVFYRKDLFEAAGLVMPNAPTWQEIYDFAVELNDPEEGIVGIALRGLPGWGENMAVFGTMINAFGARWFDMDWNPQFNTPEMKEVWEFYKKIQDDAGLPGASTAGFTEGLNFMSTGKAAMWYDATVAAGIIKAAADPAIGDNISYALAPSYKKENTGWLWAWSLAIEAASKNQDAAFKFLTWASSKDYQELVASEKGWELVPPGTRESLYLNPNYKDLPFAARTIEAMKNSDYDEPTVDPVPYKGVQYVSIPEFQDLGTKVAQLLAAYLTGQKTVDEALEEAQADALEVATDGGYLK